MIARLLDWLRRLWAAPRLTVPDTYPSTPESRAIVAEVEQRVVDAIRTAPCEPLKAPDPYRGVVGGPLLVDRTRHNRVAHYRSLGADPDANWGPWVNPYDEVPGIDHREAS